MSLIRTTKAFQYRAYPTKEQEAAMLELLETHRRLYNHALEQRRDTYKQESRCVNFNEQCRNLTQWRKTNPFLAAANNNSCQRTLRRLDRAFSDFFRRVKSGDTKAGFPRFRGIGRFASIAYTANNGSRIVGEDRAYFQGVGEVKFKCHRPVEGKIKTCAFNRIAGRWFVTFACDVEVALPDSSALPAVGIDLGLKSFLVTSEGEEVAPPQFYRKAQRKLRRLQRSVARRKQGGANRKKAIRNLARCHAHVANQRKDFHHKTAHGLVKRYSQIAHEALNVKGIAKSRLAKSTHDVGWAQFLAILVQKAECAAVQVVAVDPRHTSQTCSCCGKLPAASIGLRVRTYVCEHCGLCLDRDWNAALNILNRAGMPPVTDKPGDSLVG